MLRCPTTVPAHIVHHPALSGSSCNRFVGEKVGHLVAPRGGCFLSCRGSHGMHLISQRRGNARCLATRMALLCGNRRVGRLRHGCCVAMAENEEAIMVPGSCYSLWRRAIDISVLREVNAVYMGSLASCRCTFGSRCCT